MSVMKTRLVLTLVIIKGVAELLATSRASCRLS